MLKKLFLLLIPMAALCGQTSDTVGFVKFASELSLNSHRSDATPGVLMATEYHDSGSNNLAYLTIGNPNGVRIPVADKYALRRTPIEYIDYPNYYIELGDNMLLSGEHTVKAFHNFVTAAKSPQNPDRVEYTHTFKIIPQNGYYLLNAEVKLGEWSMTPKPDFGMGNTPDVHTTEVNGTIVVEVTVVPWSWQATWNVEVLVKSVKAVDAGLNTVCDDLNTMDYFFIDQIGATSLSKVRGWVTNRYDRYKADLWSHYPACSFIDLAGYTTKISPLFHRSLHTTEVSNDTLSFYASGARVLSIRSAIGESAGEGGTNAFRIIAIDFNSSDTWDYIYSNLGWGSPVPQERHDLVEDPWTEVTSGNWATERTMYDGADCYCTAVRKDGSSKRFYRLVAPGDGAYSNPGGIVLNLDTYAKSIAIQSPNGTYWRLSVNDNGTLSTTCISTNSPLTVAQ